MVIRGIDLRLGEPKMLQQIKGRVGQLFGGDAEGLLAEILAQRPLVEHEPDVKGRGQRAFDLFNLARAETVADQRGVVDAGAVAQGAVADGVRHDLGHFAGAVAKGLQRRRNRLVDDLEIAAPGQLLELDQREVRLDPGGVAIHHQTDGAGRGDHRGLRIAEAMHLTQAQRLIPGRFCQCGQGLVGATCGVQRDRIDVHALIPRAVAHGGAAVVADDAQHVVGIAGIAGERTQLFRHFGAGGIGHAGHDRGQGAAQGTAFAAVIAKAHVHQQAADIGIAQTQGAEVVGQLCNFLRGELRHHHRHFQGDGPQPRGMDIALGIELAVLEEGQQVHRGQVAGRIIEEHVFRAGVGTPDRPIRRAGVPGVDRIVELDAGVGAGPGGVADLVPQLAGRDGLGHLAIGAADQLPRGVVLDRVQEGVGHADRVVRILARDGDVGFRIPVGIIGREFDRGEALLRVLQHAVGVSIRDQGLFGRFDRGLQRRILRRINRVFGRAVPLADRREDLIQFQLMRLGASHQRGNLLLLDNLPVDELFDIGVIHVADHHLGRAACGAARLDRAGGTVADFQKAHQATGLAAARQLFALAPQRGKVGAGARAVFEQTRLTHPQVHDAAFVHQIVRDRLDKAGMGLRVFIGAFRFGQRAGLVIDIIVPLRRAIDAIGPMQARVEPLGAVRRSHLAREHEAHLVVIGLGIGLGGEIAALPAPISPGACQTVKHLFGRGFADNPLILRQIFQRGLIWHMAPQEFRNTRLFHALQAGRNAGLAKVFLRQHVRGHLAPALGHFDGIVLENDLAVGVANL